MRKALIYHADPEVSEQFEADMASHDWKIDTCNGMMQMLRMIQECNYEIVVLSSDRMNVELSTLLGTIRTLQNRPRIIVNLAEVIDSLGLANLARDGTIIQGKLTSEKLLEATQGES